MLQLRYVCYGTRDRGMGRDPIIRQSEIGLVLLGYLLMLLLRWSWLKVRLGCKVCCCGVGFAATPFGPPLKLA